MGGAINRIHSTWPESQNDVAQTDNADDRRKLDKFLMKTPCRPDETILKQLVAEYKRSEFRSRALKEMEAFRKLLSLEVAILDAVKLSPINGKKHDHQWRIPKDILDDAQEKLLAAKQAIKAAKDFEALHAIVEARIGPIPGVGDLVIYDIAHRIGAFLRLEPKRVYLHRGTAEGARLLGFLGPTVDPKDLPEPLSQLTAAEIEDFLCIYKSRLKKNL